MIFPHIAKQAAADLADTDLTTAIDMLRMSFERLRAIREEMHSKVEKYRMLKEIKDVVATEGYSNTINLLYGQELLSFAPSITVRDNDAIVRELSVACEGILSTIMEQYGKAMAKIKDELRQMFGSYTKIQQAIRQRVVEVRDLQVEPARAIETRIVGIPVDHIYATFKVIEVITEKPINIPSFGGKYSDDVMDIAYDALLKHVDSLHLRADKKALITFNTNRIRYEPVPEARRFVLSISASGIKSSKDAVALADALLASVYTQNLTPVYTEYTDKLLSVLNAFPIDKYNEACSIYTAYDNALYSGLTVPLYLCSEFALQVIGTLNAFK